MEGKFANDLRNKEALLKQRSLKNESYSEVDNSIQNISLNDANNESFS